MKKGEQRTESNRAVFGGETVESRILLSATWIDDAHDNGVEASDTAAHCLDEVQSPIADHEGAWNLHEAMLPILADEAAKTARAAGVIGSAISDPVSPSPGEPADPPDAPNDGPPGSGPAHGAQPPPGGIGTATGTRPAPEGSDITPEETRFTMSVPARDGGAPDDLLPFGLLPEDLDDGETRDRVAPPNLVFAEAGDRVTLRPSLGADREGGEGAPETVRWTQVGGPTLASEPATGGGLQLQLPQVFVEEELTFRVEILNKGQRTMQEVTVHIEPADLTNLPLAIDRYPPLPEQTQRSDDLEAERVAPERGVGKLWAVMLAVSGGPKGGKKSLAHGHEAGDQNGSEEPLAALPTGLRSKPPFRS